MDTESGYKKLQVYILSHELGVKVHEMSLNLPKFEIYEEGSQIRRSAKSVSSNIVEGYSLRKYKNEYLHYLYRAHGSSEETTEHLRYLFKTKSLTDEKLYEQLANEYKKLNGMLFNYIRFVEKNYDTPTFLKEPKNRFQILKP
ncbi:MAG: four helix bundle protein [Bacteriovoracaceae bacterium]|nr:four helix bundle protein [Bacteroidota bacterium]